MNNGFQTAIGPTKDDGTMNIIWHWMRVQEVMNQILNFTLVISNFNRNMR